MDPSAKSSIVQDCGWGRVLFGQTFASSEELTREMLNERPNKRDIAIYVEHPHVVLSYAPQQLFLDPSDTLRLDLSRFAGDNSAAAGVEIRRIHNESEAEAVNDIYIKRGMVPVSPGFAWKTRASEELIFLVAVDSADGAVLGTVMGLHHARIFDDPARGSSLWSLAVDPLSSRPGVGQALVIELATYFMRRDCAFMDLSVIHDNKEAKSLYRKLGFEPIKVFAIKSKNAINESLFIGPSLDEQLNPYGRIIVDEARARGIDVEILDAEEGYFRMSSGGKSMVCRESLTELTSAVAMSRCQDKFVTHRWLAPTGLKTPAYRIAGAAADNEAFLLEHGSVVVKPCNGEQGNGVSVGIRDVAQMEAAIENARRYCARVLLETYHTGQDLRVIVINGAVIAAAIRRPAQIIGDGQHDVKTLIAKQSRRRQAATGGESTIPLDAETERCVRGAGYELSSVVPEGVALPVRKTANLHTGGTIHDVTDILHPRLVEASCVAARRLQIPVVGLDFIVQDPTQPEYVIIEANERPGLANHEPQPTAQRLIDLLFPLSAAGHLRTVGISIK